MSKVRPHRHCRFCVCAGPVPGLGRGLAAANSTPRLSAFLWRPSQMPAEGLHACPLSLCSANHAALLLRLRTISIMAGNSDKIITMPMTI